MLAALHEMGYRIKERELTRMRKHMGCVFRAQNNHPGKDQRKGKRKRDSEEEAVTAAATEDAEEPGRPSLDNDLGKQLQEAVNEPHTEERAQAPSHLPLEAPHMPPSTSDIPVPDPSGILAKQSRLTALAIESAERYKSRTRRRRTRPFAGIPADPPGPPRFPSETTLEEAKVILNLDNQTYSHLRQVFAQICSNEGIRKKTDAGNQKWAEIKGILVASSPHLGSIFAAITQIQAMSQPPVGEDYGPSSYDVKKLHVALDVLCSDVTKRLRTPSTKLPLAAARNVLGLDPNSARQLCGSLRSILIRDGFTSKIEAGEQHWEELKREWIQGSELLTRIVTEEGDKGKKGSEKVLAMETLARDVMKRLRDEQTGRLARNRTKLDNAQDDHGFATENAALKDITHGESHDPTAPGDVSSTSHENVRMGTAPMLPNTQSPDQTHVSVAPSSAAMPPPRQNPRRIHHEPGGRQLAYLARKKLRQQEEAQQQHQQQQAQQATEQCEEVEIQRKALHDGEKPLDEKAEKLQQAASREEYSNMQIDPLLMLAAANSQMGERDAG